MARKKTLKVGDRVLFNEDDTIYGVIVHKYSDQNISGKVWNVHWYNPRKDMRSGRGVYSEHEITKSNPYNQKVEINAEETE